MPAIELDISTITDKQVKGVELTIKALKKSFPFIKGWDYRYDNYSSVLFITLIVNLDEITQYVKGTLHPIWKDIINKEPYYTSTLSMPYKEKEVQNYTQELRLSIEKKISNVYNSIPDEYRILNTLTPQFGQPFEFKVDISISNYRLI